MAKHRRSRKSRKAASSTVIRSPSEAMHPGSSAKTSYSGPIMIPGAMMQNAPVAVNLNFTGTLMSDSLGTINTVFNNNPSVYADWSNYAGVYDEYRWLAHELEFFPDNRYSKTTTVCTPGVGVVDRDDTSLLPSIGSGIAYESSVILSLEDPWTDRKHYRSALPSIKMKMNGVRESNWITTAAPVALGGIKIRFDNLSSNTSYGRVLVRGLFQFRGRE